MSRVLDSLSALLGQPVALVDFIYPDELCLHFGELRPYDLPQLAHHRRAEWVLCTSASGWRLTAADGSVVAEVEADARIPEREEIERAIQVAVGHTVRVIARTRPHGLMLELGDGFRFDLAADPDERELRQWALDMPEHRQVEAAADGELHLLSRCDTLEPERVASFTGAFELRR